MNNDQLIDFLEILKADIIHSLQANGSDPGGNMSKGITVAKNDNNYQLQLPGYLKFLETGRGPTSPDATMSNPPMIQRIQQWCREKGIPEKAAWAIKKTIDEKGYKGKPGILSEPLSEANINMRLNPVTDAMANTLAAGAVKSLNL
jgi:hypothetical protein